MPYALLGGGEGTLRVAVARYGQKRDETATIISLAVLTCPVGEDNGCGLSNVKSISLAWLAIMVDLIKEYAMFCQEMRYLLLIGSSGPKFSATMVNTRSWIGT